MRIERGARLVPSTHAWLQSVLRKLLEELPNIYIYINGAISLAEGATFFVFSIGTRLNQHSKVALIGLSLGERRSLRRSLHAGKGRLSNSVFVQPSGPGAEGLFFYGHPDTLGGKLECPRHMRHKHSILVFHNVNYPL